jgi:hypothetical protein
MIHLLMMIRLRLSSAFQSGSLTRITLRSFWGTRTNVQPPTTARLQQQCYHPTTALKLDNSAERQIETLRWNNPDRKSFTITVGRYFTDDYELSEALRANDHVNEIWLDLAGLPYSTCINWNSLLCVLSTRVNFEKVFVYDHNERLSTKFTPELVTPFLLAIQQNPNIQIVDLWFVRLSGDSMASFIDTATSVTDLQIKKCSMEPTGGALAVAAALQRNTNIQRLKLSELDAADLIPIVSSLAANTGVKALGLAFFRHQIPLNLSLAVKLLLESTTNIQRFHFNGFGHYESNVDVDTFRPIAQGLIQSRTVTEVKLEGWNFNSQEVVRVLNSILESKSNLQSLDLDTCTVHEDGQEEFRATILRLLQPHSLLRSLDLRQRSGLSRYGFGSVQDFNRLVTAVESSPLERFSIGSISKEIVPALVASIPKMHVLTLELKLDSDHKTIGDIMHAFRQNASLRTLVVKDWLDRDLFNNKDKMN